MKKTNPRARLAQNKDGLPCGKREIELAYGSVSMGQKSVDATGNRACLYFNPNGSDPLDSAEKNLAFYQNFANEYRSIPYARILWPGVDLAAFIQRFVRYSNETVSPDLRERAFRMLEEYSVVYEKLTGYPYDATAPTQVLPFQDFYDSVKHFH